MLKIVDLGLLYKTLFIPCYNIVTMAEKNSSPKGSEFWQIYFPALLGLIFIGLICAWVVIGVSPANVTRMAEISTVLLVIPVLIFSLLNFVLLGLLIYLVQRMIQALPPFTSRILDLLEAVRNWVEKFSELIVQPDDRVAVTGPNGSVRAH